MRELMLQLRWALPSGSSGCSLTGGRTTAFGEAQGMLARPFIRSAVAT